MKRNLLLILLFTITLQLHAQKNSLLFSKGMLSKTGKSVQIELSDSNGLVNPSAEFFNASEFLYFLVKPLEGQDWTLSKKDVEKRLFEMKFIQDGYSSPIIRIKPILENQEIKAVVVSFNKLYFNVLLEGKFQLDESSSEAIKIPESLWPGYKKYNEAYQRSLILLEKGLLIDAFDLSMQMWSHDTLLHHFSFYKAEKDTLNVIIDRLITEFNTQIDSAYVSLKSSTTEKRLVLFQQVKDTVLTRLSRVDSFLSANLNELSADSKAITLFNVKNKVQKIASEAIEYYRKKKLSIFEEKNYTDYQFKLYSELIARLITSTENIQKEVKADTLSLARISSFTDFYKELVGMGWVEDFYSVCRLLNENIQKRSYLFNDTAISNYFRNKSAEPQPYSVLFKAWNALIQNDNRLFMEQIVLSFQSLSDKEMLSGIDMVCAMNRAESLDNEEYWTLMRKGWSAEFKGSVQEARGYYERAEKLTNAGELLLFLLGKSSLKLGDRYTAEVYFKRANTLNPKFVSPKLFQIDFLIEDKDYETALTQVNEALISNQIWYFYYKKALLLLLTEKYTDARQILQNNCITLNPMNYEQYLVLGDVFYAQGDMKSARENYMKAGNINPNDNGFKNRMESLKQAQETKP